MISTGYKQRVYPDKEAELRTFYENNYSNDTKYITTQNGDVLKNSKSTNWYFCNSKNVQILMDTPTVPPMDSEEIIDFIINTKRRPDCKYNKRVFSVKKKKHGEGKNMEWIFETEGEGGYIYCKVGYIEELMVYTKAENCGLGTHLTRLCLTDSDLNVEERKDHADKFPKRAEWFKSYCTSVWHLRLNHVINGWAYFQAAEYEDYTKMIIKTALGKIHPGKEAADTIVYHKQFHQDGKISAGDGKAWFFTSKTDWYFCKERLLEYKMDGPIVPQMSVEKPISFEIDKHFRSKCSWGNRTFKIEKKIVSNPGSPLIFEFFAENDDWGVIQCRKGQVFFMKVSKETAKHCGLETHLFRLCLSDRDLNVNIKRADGQNRVEKYFANARQPNITDARINWIKNNCIYFWLIELRTKDPSYGKFLFEAALREQFYRMIIGDLSNKIVHPSTAENAERTQIWKARYDNDTGFITDDWEGEVYGKWKSNGVKWPNRNADWFFCRQEKRSGGWFY